MTYREDMHALATALAELVRDGGVVPAGDLDLALTAHATVVESLIALHRGVTGITASVEGPTLAGLERHPVGVLGRVLRRQPRVAPLSLTDVVASTPDDPATQSWRHAARHAAVAVHEWNAAASGSKPHDAAAWSEVADLASLSHAIAILNADLAKSLRAAGRDTLAGRFESAATSGLTTTAAAISELAARGPLPASEDLAPQPMRRVALVRRPEHLPAAIDRLGYLVRTATDLSPVHVQEVARTLAAAAQRAASTLGAVEGPGSSAVAALDAHVASLLAVNGVPRRVATLSPSDPLPLAQAQQIYYHLGEIARWAEPLTEAVARSVAGSAARTTMSLGEAAATQVHQGRWLVPQEGGAAGPGDWAPALRGSRGPELARVVADAAISAGGVTAALPAVSDRRAWPRPRDVLRELLSEQSAVKAASRPRSPGIPAARRR